MFTLNPENLEWIIRNRSYVVYPPEEQRPPIVRGDEEIYFFYIKNRIGN